MGKLIDTEDFFTRMENETDICAEIEKYGLVVLKKYLDMQPAAFDMNDAMERIKKIAMENMAMSLKKEEFEENIDTYSRHCSLSLREVYGVLKDYENIL